MKRQSATFRKTVKGMPTDLTLYRRIEPSALRAICEEDRQDYFRYCAGITVFEKWLTARLYVVDGPNGTGHFLLHSARANCPECKDNELLTWNLANDEGYHWYWCPMCFNHTPLHHQLYWHFDDSPA